VCREVHHTHTPHNINGSIPVAVWRHPISWTDFSRAQVLIILSFIAIEIAEDGRETGAGPPGERRLALVLKNILLLPSPPLPSLWSTTQTKAVYGGLCGMPACGQAVGCGVCDTPELWRGAVGLCARVRACAGAAESLHTYIHTRTLGSAPCACFFIFTSVLPSACVLVCFSCMSPSYGAAVMISLLTRDVID